MGNKIRASKKQKKQSDIKDFAYLFTDKVKGEYAFVLFEYNKNNELINLVAGRDEIGVRPLYYHKPDTSTYDLVFSSEIKGLDFFKGKIAPNIYHKRIEYQTVDKIQNDKHIYIINIFFAYPNIHFKLILIAKLPDN